MKRLALLLSGLLLALPAAAEFYRWVDEKGGVHYSDMPPPLSVKKVQRVSTPRFAADDAAKSGQPVIMYTGNCGATCDQAAEFLGKRGVPYTERNISKNKEAVADLKKRTGGTEIPVLFVGDTMQRGYSPTLWDKMLEMGGYPEKAKAPPKETPKAEPEAKTEGEYSGGKPKN